MRGQCRIQLFPRKYLSAYLIIENDALAGILFAVLVTALAVVEADMQSEKLVIARDDARCVMLKDAALLTLAIGILSTVSRPSTNVYAIFEVVLPFVHNTVRLLAFAIHVNAPVVPSVDVHEPVRSLLSTSTFVPFCVSVFFHVPSNSCS